ncbi:MAG: hypothetical protein HQL51_04745 [Magnetococcales bacterium]|nr:hypothetical protein [Magnetococcales bacterium]
MPTISPPSHGPCGGPLLRHVSGYVELSVFETGVPPRFRLYFLDHDLQPVPPPAAETVTMETERPGEIRQRFTFRGEEAFLESLTNIPEPHEFLARVELEGGVSDWPSCSPRRATTTPMATIMTRRAPNMEPTAVP